MIRIELLDCLLLLIVISKFRLGGEGGLVTWRYSREVDVLVVLPGLGEVDLHHLQSRHFSIRRDGRLTLDLADRDHRLVHKLIREKVLVHYLI